MTQNTVIQENETQGLGGVKMTCLQTGHTQKMKKKDEIEKKIRSNEPLTLKDKIELTEGLSLLLLLLFKVNYEQQTKVERRRRSGLCNGRGKRRP